MKCIFKKDLKNGTNLSFILLFRLCLQLDECPKRGLEGNDQQTFVMALPRNLRMKYDSVMFEARTEVGFIQYSHMYEI